jgi:hypothetical protein
VEAPSKNNTMGGGDQDDCLQKSCDGMRESADNGDDPVALCSFSSTEEKAVFF